MVDKAAERVAVAQVDAKAKIGVSGKAVAVKKPSREKAFEATPSASVGKSALADGASTRDVADKPASDGGGSARDACGSKAGDDGKALSPSQMEDRWASAKLRMQENGSVPEELSESEQRVNAEISKRRAYEEVAKKIKSLSQETDLPSASAALEQAKSLLASAAQQLAASPNGAGTDEVARLQALAGAQLSVAERGVTAAEKEEAASVDANSEVQGSPNEKSTGCCSGLKSCCCFCCPRERSRSELGL